MSHPCGRGESEARRGSYGLIFWAEKRLSSRSQREDGGRPTDGRRPIRRKPHAMRPNECRGRQPITSAGPRSLGADAPSSTGETHAISLTCGGGREADGSPAATMPKTQVSAIWYEGEHDGGFLAPTA